MRLQMGMACSGIRMRPVLTLHVGASGLRGAGGDERARRPFAAATG